MSAPRRQRRKEARPTEIIAAAVKLFSERGFAATRLEDVAEAAGISKAAIYLYFDSKADLFKAMVRAYAAPRVDLLEAFVNEFDGASTDLLHLLYARLGDIAHNPELRAIIKIVLSEAGNFPDIAAFYREEIAFRALRNVARIVERGIAHGEFRPCDPVAAAQSIIFPIIMNALAREIFGADAKLDPEKFMSGHLQFVLHALSSEPPAPAQRQE